MIDQLRISIHIVMTVGMTIELNRHDLKLILHQYVIHIHMAILLEMVRKTCAARVVHELHKKVQDLFLPTIHRHEGRPKIRMQIHDECHHKRLQDHHGPHHKDLYLMTIYL